MSHRGELRPGKSSRQIRTFGYEVHCPRFILSWAAGVRSQVLTCLISACYSMFKFGIGNLEGGLANSRLKCAAEAVIVIQAAEDLKSCTKSLYA